MDSNHKAAARLIVAYEANPASSSADSTSLTVAVVGERHRLAVRRGPVDALTVAALERDEDRRTGWDCCSFG